MPNFKLSQDWVGYLQRSYATIKQSVINRLVTLTPEITDHTESNILIIIVSIFAGIAEMINLYIDRAAQEAFLGSCRRYSSAIKLVRLIDYHVKAIIPATVDETFTLVDSSTLLPVNAATPILIPAGTAFTNANNIPYFTTQDAILAAGSSLVIIPSVQAEDITAANLGTTDGTSGQMVALPGGYVDGSMSIDINGITWVLKTTLALSMPNDKVFVVNIDETQTAQLTFGDGVNGAIPPSGYVIYGDYQMSYGADGNSAPNTLTTLVSPITTPTGTQLSITNNLDASNGTDYESLEDIKNLAPRSIRTLNRAVTYQDYIDIALQAPGVGDAKVKYCCGGPVNAYIIPTSKGIATSSLINSTQAYMQCRSIIGRKVKVYSAGITRIWVKINVQALYGVSIANAFNDTVTALDANFGYANSTINRAIRISDITAAIDNLPTVDYLNLDEIWAEPYARPTNSTHELLWDRTIGPGAITKKSWTIIYRSTPAGFEVYLNGDMIGTANIGTPFADPDTTITFTINASAYSDGDRWDFITYPFGQDIIVDDNTIPIIEVDLTTVPATGFFNITVEKTNISTTCNPPC